MYSELQIFGHQIPSFYRHFYSATIFVSVFCLNSHFGQGSLILAPKNSTINFASFHWTVKFNETPLNAIE